jgi:hypothetical protein
MLLQESLKIGRPRDDVVDALCRDDTLLKLIPGETEIVDRGADRITTRTRYRALGQEGSATFDWNFLMDGSLTFAKVCDGRVWRDLHGSVTVEEEGERVSRVKVEMSGRTRSLIPELTIKGPMAEQMSSMIGVLERLLSED